MEHNTRPPRGFIGLNSARRAKLGLPEAVGHAFYNTILHGNDGGYYQLTFQGWRKLKPKDIAAEALRLSQRLASDNAEKKRNEVEKVRPALPMRADILNRGINIATGSRNEAYGDPLSNFEAIAALKSVFWHHAARAGMGLPFFAQNSAFGHAIDMVLNNVGRIASAPSQDALLASDRYTDGATYLAIAYEVGKRMLDDQNDDLNAGVQSASSGQSPTQQAEPAN